MPKILTKRKEAWANHFKPNILKGTPLNPNIASEVRYYEALRKLILTMTANVESQLNKFFESDHAQEYFGEDASTASQARILTNALADKFKNLFALYAKPMAEKVVKEADKNSKNSLHQSLKQLSGGLSLKTGIITGDLEEVLSASVTENVGLIKSIASEYLSGVQGAVMRSITTGNGLQDLVPFLKKHEGITLRRARIIAEDQTRKAYNNLNKGRMQAIGIKQYEWLHSAGGVHPRPLHIAYSGRIFDFDKPPVIDLKTGERGIPGQAINCRCRMAPVISFEEAE